MTNRFNYIIVLVLVFAIFVFIFALGHYGRYLEKIKLSLLTNEESINREDRYSTIGIHSPRNQSTEVREVKVDTKTYLLPDDILFKMPWSNFSVSAEIKGPTAEARYKKIVSRIEAECRHRYRIGAVGDGGWDVCVAGPFQPKSDCLVYDFGINNAWTFDDCIVSEFGCLVRAFDPTMEKKEHIHGTDVHFYPVGLSGTNGNITIKNRMCPVKTLGTLMKELGDMDKTIDYLKIDIESSEWASLPEMLSSGILQKKVKQMGLEVHGHGNAQQVNLLSQLSAMGFKKWHHHWNHHCVYKSSGKGFFTNCNEIYFINVNFLLEKQ